MGNRVFVIIYQHQNQVRPYVLDWAWEEVRGWTWNEFIHALEKLDPDFSFSEGDSLDLCPDVPIYKVSKLTPQQM